MEDLIIENLQDTPQVNIAMKRTYIIIPANSVQNINFEQVLETSIETLRYSVDNTKTFVKYEGETEPDIISEALTVNDRIKHTHSQILEILSTSEWTPTIEEGI